MKAIIFFTMLAFCGAVLLPGCSKNGDDPITYSITVSAVDGVVTAEVNSAPATTAVAGESVTLTATSNDVYSFKQWTVEKGGITLSNAESATTTFIMPAADVAVKAEFVVRSVTINGVTWALRNVNVPGTLAANFGDAGMFYQWNRRTSWSSSNPRTSFPAGKSWDRSNATGTLWESANNPCPAGWRVPTQTEQRTLLDTQKVRCDWKNLYGMNFMEFTDRNTGSSVNFPASGYRDFDNGQLYYVGTNGLYWSGSSDGSNGHFLWFNEIGASQFPINKSNAFSVRCVVE